MKRCIMISVVLVFSLLCSGCNKKTVDVAEAPKPTDKPAYDDSVDEKLDYNTTPSK